MKEKEKKSDIKLLGKIIKLATPYRKVWWIAVVLTLINAALGPARPILIQYTLDHAVLTKNQEELFQLAMLLIGLLFINTLFTFVQNYATFWLGQQVIKDLREKVYAHFTRLKLSILDRTPVGTLVTRTVSDIETLANVFSEGIIMILGDLLQIIVIVYLMFFLNWKLALVSLSVLPLLLISAYVFKEKVRKSFTIVRNAVSNLNAFTQEHITGMQIVQAFNREKHEQKKFEKINKQHQDANIQSVLYYSVFFPVVEIITAMSIGLVVWWGIDKASDWQVSYGDIVAFIMFINMFFRPIRQLADRVNTLQMGMVAAERVFKFIEKQHETETEGTYIPETFEGKIEFKNVWFAYQDEDWVLKDISLTIEPKSKVAFIGRTGSGKSTIVNLITRMYEVQKGEILIDGMDVKNYDLSFLRQKFGTLQQDVFLFSGSVKNNITLYNDNIKEIEIIQAAKQMGIHDFIDGLPGKYDFEVLERGGVLSTGQRQLIAFVRAMVYNPDVIILDEATAAVDTKTEELIQKAIQVLLQGRTSITIAHRLSTIKDADHIIVLEKGKIKEQGSPEILLKNEGVYHQMLNNS